MLSSGRVGPPEPFGYAAAMTIPVFSSLLCLAACVLAGCAAAPQATLPRPVAVSGVQGRWAIAIHGGAGMLDPAMPEPMKAEYRAALGSALAAGETILSSGGASLDAVEAAVRVLEDHPLFNAGRGAVLTREGVAELDASIMEGRTLKCGAVCGVRTVKNPISLARRVMQDTPHAFFSGAGAEELARGWSLERVDPGYFVTPRRREQLELKMKELGLPPPPPSPGLPRAEGSGRSGIADAGDATGTVGCVALDIHGDLAAATSTGGMTAKMPGRIGDSPIIGAGTYANNETLAVSCTGTGEQFMRHVAAHELSSLVRYARLPLTDAVDTVLTRRLDVDDGGLIAIDRQGQIVMQTTTGCMPRASADSSGARTVAMWDPESK